jgi:sugar phosphate isomerase/epimerase
MCLLERYRLEERAQAADVRLYACRMYKALSPGAIGVSTNSLEERVHAARSGGFAGVELDIAEVARRGVDECRHILGDIKPSGWGLPTNWRGDEADWRRDLESLPSYARAASELGCPRTFTWILSGSNDRALAENRAFHIERFRPISETLDAHGCMLGLEFLGPKTLRDQFKHEFIWRMADMLDMANEIGPNVGLLLDAWHWYTGGGTPEDIRQLSANDVVYVHVNDAPAGVRVDEQVDHTRSLPGETGVIPIKEFFAALREIGYDGPIVAEPFKKELSELATDSDRLRVISQSLDKILAQ